MHSCLDCQLERRVVLGSLCSYAIPALLMSQMG